MSTVGQQILSETVEITNIATAISTLIGVFVKARDQFVAAHPNTPIPEAWNDAALSAAISALNNDAAALMKHAQDVQARQQAAIDAGAAAGNALGDGPIGVV